MVPRETSQQKVSATFENLSSHKRTILNFSLLKVTFEQLTNSVFLQHDQKKNLEGNEFSWHTESHFLRPYIHKEEKKNLHSAIYLHWSVNQSKPLGTLHVLTVLHISKSGKKNKGQIKSSPNLKLQGLSCCTPVSLLHA